ncbi:unnamed protein product [Pylaiella littoralis]
MQRRVRGSFSMLMHFVLYLWQISQVVSVPPNVCSYRSSTKDFEVVLSFVLRSSAVLRISHFMLRSPVLRAAEGRCLRLSSRPVFFVCCAHKVCSFFKCMRE